MSKDFLPIKIYNEPDQSVFDEIQQIGEPAILKQCDFGKCFTLWTPEYLAKKIGHKIVRIHASRNSKLNFLEKNFTYQSIEFNEFMKMLTGSVREELGDYLYLRSTSDDTRSRQATKIENSFPSLKEDLKPPNFIPYSTNNCIEPKRYFSSVLRIASNNVQIWTHYDLYDNVLCQVLGTKRVVLFKPSDIRYLYVIGDKSSIENLEKVDLEKYPKYAKSSPYRCILHPGDTLYIPALWWHNIKTLDDVEFSKYPCSIGFNIFWKDIHVDEDFYDPIDVYGNKNLVAMNSACLHVDKAVSALKKLPPKYSQFYSLMLIHKLKNKFFEEPR